uniref:Uncharacterized protein n=1 Tax=Cannabis sativa TaxID=3483 RepID=A0A803P9V2_CANSA
MLLAWGQAGPGGTRVEIMVADGLELLEREGTGGSHAAGAGTLGRRRQAPHAPYLEWETRARLGPLDQQSDGSDGEHAVGASGLFLQPKNLIFFLKILLIFLKGSYVIPQFKMKDVIPHSFLGKILQCPPLKWVY